MLVINFPECFSSMNFVSALSSDANFLAGLNVCKGKVTYKAVAEELGYEYINPAEAIN